MKWGRILENIIDKIYGQLNKMLASDQKIGKTIIEDPVKVMNVTWGPPAQSSGWL